MHSDNTEFIFKNKSTLLSLNNLSEENSRKETEISLVKSQLILNLFVKTVNVCENRLRFQKKTSN